MLRACRTIPSVSDQAEGEASLPSCSNFRFTVRLVCKADRARDIPLSCLILLSLSLDVWGGEEKDFSTIGDSQM